MSVSAVLGVLGLLLLASTANSQNIQFSENDYSVMENDPGGRELQLTKTGTNIGEIFVTLTYRTLADLRAGLNFSETDYDTEGLETAELNSIFPDDFDATQVGGLSFPPSPNITDIFFNPPVIPDTIHEVDEGFFVIAQISFSELADQNAFEDNILTGNTALIIITNDDTLEFDWELLDIQLQEDSGSTDVVIRKRNDIVTEVTVVVMVEEDTASSGINPSDFFLDLVLPTTIEFLPIHQNRSINLTIVDDPILELVESFSWSLFKNTSVPNIDIAPGRGRTTITITDNEIIQLGFDRTLVTVSEGDGTATVGLIVFQPDPSLVSLEFGQNPNTAGFFNFDTADNSAIAPDDYSAIDGTITVTFDLGNTAFVINPNQIMIDIIDDNTTEEAENLTLILAPAFALGFSSDSLSASPDISEIIITDNDANPSVISFVQEFYNVTEGDGTVVICVGITSPSDLSLLLPDYQANLTFSLQNLLAEDGLDFDGFTVDFNLTIANPQECFTVNITDDEVLEVTEDFSASILSVGDLPQAASLGIQQAFVNIFDNDNGTVGFEVVDVIVTEGIGVFAVIRISFLDPATIAFETFTELSIFTVDGDATNVSDYTQTIMTITLRGDGEESLEIMVPITNDFIVEDNETLTIEFTNISDSGNIAVYEPTVATILIIDDDVPTDVVIGLEQNLYITSENDSAVEICAAILDPITMVALLPDLDTFDPTFEANLNFSLTQDTALAGNDYIDIFESFSLTPSVTRQCFNVSINDDGIFELTEYFNASLGVIGLLPDGAQLGITNAQVRLLDNEVAVIGLRDVSHLVNESAGTIDIYIEFISPAEISEDVEVNVTVYTMNGTATDGSDFDGFNVSLTLRGVTDEMAFTQLQILNDDVVEMPPSEGLMIFLTSNDFLVDELRIMIEPDQAVVVILDDDEYVDTLVGFVLPSYNTTEGDGFVEICAGILEPANASILRDTYVASFNLSLVPDTATADEDYGNIFTMVSFTPSSPIQCFNITIEDDQVLEIPEYFSGLLTPLDPLPAAITLGDLQTNIVIFDNDEGVIGFDVDNVMVFESDGIASLQVSFLSPLEVSPSVQVNLSLATMNDTALSGSDYVELIVDFFTLNGGEVYLVDIVIINDTIEEIPNAENFTVNLLALESNVPLTVSPERADVTIIDDDEPVMTVIGFEFVSYNVSEDALSVTICASVLEPNDTSLLDSAFQVFILFSVEDGTATTPADFENVAEALEFTFTNTTVCVEVGIVDDNDLENTEEFTVRLSPDGTLPAGLRIMPDLATVSIFDNEVASVIGFDEPLYRVGEGNGYVEICVSIQSPDPSTLPSTYSATVNITTLNGSATSPEDFTMLDVTYTLTPNDSTVCVNITIVDDVMLENEEYFSATLVGNLPPAGVFNISSTMIIIEDNEVGSVIGFDEPLYRVGEGDGYVEICVSIQSPDPLTLPSTYSATVNITTLNGSATSPEDFTMLDVTYTLTPNDSTVCVNVTIEDDVMLENEEYFSATLVGNLPPAGVFNISSTMIVIEDNEDGVIGILNESLVVYEDEGNATIYVGFVEPDLISEDIIVYITFYTQDDSAIAGSDYTAVNVTFPLQGRRQEIYPINIPIMIDDDATELPERFLTNIISPDPLPAMFSLNPDNGNVIINNVDPPTEPPGGGSGGDPHYSIMLPSGQLLCFSVHGEKNFPFNLISNDLLQMNAFFIEDALRDEITWIGSLGVVVQHTHYKKSNTTKLRFEAHDRMIYINNGISLQAKRVEKLTLENGKLTISEALRRRGDRKPEVEVNLVDIGLHFTVRFVKKRHLDMMWKKVDLQPENSHGFIGQFLRKGVEIDETRKLLYLPSLDPVPVMRSSVWHFMERETPDPDQKFCWQAMNPGYQGKMLIEGTYLDYLVDDVLSSDFKFNPTSNE